MKKRTRADRTKSFIRIKLFILLEGQIIKCMHPRKHGIYTVRIMTYFDKHLDN